VVCNGHEPEAPENTGNAVPPYLLVTQSTETQYEVQMDRTYAASCMEPCPS